VKYISAVGSIIVSCVCWGGTAGLVKMAQKPVISEPLTA
jgi:hypothetical protein